MRRWPFDVTRLLDFSAQTLGIVTALAASEPGASPLPRPEGKVLTGKDAMGDWTTDVPGLRRRLTLDDLPRTGRHPLRPEPAEDGPPARRCDASGSPGFEVTEFASGLRQPRVIVAPQRRPLRRRERGEPDSPLSGLRLRRQARDQHRLRHRTGTAVRDRFLSAGPESHACVRRQHRLGRAVRVQEWRHQGRNTYSLVNVLVGSGACSTESRAGVVIDVVLNKGNAIASLHLA